MNWAKILLYNVQFKVALETRGKPTVGQCSDSIRHRRHRKYSDAPNFKAIIRNLFRGGVLFCPFFPFSSYFPSLSHHKVVPQIQLRDLETTVSERERRLQPPDTCALLLMLLLSVADRRRQWHVSRWRSLYTRTVYRWSTLGPHPVLNPLTTSPQMSFVLLTYT